MKLLSIALSVTFLLLLTSCSKDEKPIAVERQTDPVKVVITGFSMGDYNPDYINKLNELLKQNNYSVTVETFPNTPTYDELFSKLKDYYNDDYAIITNMSYRSVVEGAPLQDLSKYADIAPSYFSEVEVLDNTVVPFGLGKDTILPPHLGVLVRNELYDEYGGSITTATEYDQFLQWVESEKPQYVPALFPPPYNDNFGFTAVIYNLLLPEMGYLPLDRYLFEGAGICMDLSSGEFIPIEKLPVLDEFIEKAKYWNKYQAFRLLTDDYSDITSTNDAASIVQTSNFYLGDKFTSPPSSLLYDSNDFTLCILYPDKLPERKFGPYRRGIYAKEGVDLSEFFYLLEELQTNIDLFTNIYFGEEGVDYQIVNNKLELLETDLHDAEYFFGFTTYFHNNTFYEQLIGGGTIQQKEALDAIRYPEIPAMESVYAAAKKLSILTQKELYFSRVYYDRSGKLQTLLNKFFLNDSVDKINREYQFLPNPQQILNDLQAE